MSFCDILKQHEASQKRKAGSLTKLNSARKAFSKDAELKKNKRLCIFAAGSLGRLDSGLTSDLDVFVTTTGHEIGRLQEIKYFASILSLNEQLGYPPLSNDGEFLKVFHVLKNETKVGSAVDDTENWFTTRMLLLLESNYLYNKKSYHSHKKKILDFYFRDSAGQEDFRPVFLLNDILRYWRTLCLNYEQKARTSPSKSWKKKNFNLKFSRMLSVFGTVLPLVLMKNVTSQKIEELSSIPPMERLAQGLDALNAPDLQNEFKVVLDYYEYFLSVKETQNFNEVTEEVRKDLQAKSTFISQFIFNALNRDSVPSDFRRYLVI